MRPLVLYSNLSTSAHAFPLNPHPLAFSPEGLTYSERLEDGLVHVLLIIIIKYVTVVALTPCCVSNQAGGIERPRNLHLPKEGMGIL